MTCNTCIYMCFFTFETMLHFGMRKLGLFLFIIVYSGLYFSCHLAWGCHSEDIMLAHTSLQKVSHHKRKYF